MAKPLRKAMKRLNSRQEKYNRLPDTPSGVHKPSHTKSGQTKPGSMKK